MIKFKEHPKYDTVISWGKLLSITGSAQIIIQTLGFASGILIIRLLTVQEYAFYTLANTMLGMMAVLADGGIVPGVMAQGGKVWENRQKMGAVLATGLDLRRKFAIASLLVSVPILFYLLLHNGASWVMALLIAAALIPAFYATLSDSLLEIIPKLNQTIVPLQRNQIEVGVARLFLSGLTMFIFPWAFVAVLTAGIPRTWGNIGLRKIVYTMADKDQKPNEEVKKEILSLVKRILPTSIYYCFSGQITIWLVSIFGNTHSLAQLGALSKVSVMLSIFNVIIATLIIPHFAKLMLNRYLLFNRFLQIMGLLIVLISLIIFIVYLFPTPILWLLGDAYKGLQFELLLSIISSCIGLLGGVVFNLYTSRGWAMSPTVSILINLFSIVFFARLLDLSNLKGVLLFNIALGVVSLLQTVLFCTYNIFLIKNNDIT
ncbi:lipopolysaccharide biosynthesis protein [Flavobacterium saccharophilum]|uniref:Membrane protein involved in the export of O-antigen and teichoic acid n=1 Tax=Flavobacterium saccharophilum TaxID=29534 RepID=A0A1M7INN7_9FLAO|nr:polysaccharide biosynthesis protein [Flavobacterium saccharophilum]SHM42412.1 Membrane protein involved in the export of O-antigen and teichoic acid [Flavobacterium saccharophilum]